MGFDDVSWDDGPKSKTKRDRSKAYDTAISVKQDHDMIVLMLKPRFLVKSVQHLVRERSARPLDTHHGSLPILYRSSRISGLGLQNLTILDLIIMF